MEKKPRGPAPKTIDARLCGALAAQGLSDVQIAEALGIDRTTLQRRKRASAEFAETCSRGRAKGLEKMTNALFNSGLKGNVVAMKYFLSNRDPERWRERKDFTTDGEKLPGPVVVYLPAKEEPEE